MSRSRLANQPIRLGTLVGSSDRKEGEGGGKLHHMGKVIERDTGINADLGIPVVLGLCKGKRSVPDEPHIFS